MPSAQRKFRFGSFISGPPNAHFRPVSAPASAFDWGAEADRLTRVPGMSPAVWREPALLYFYAANLILGAGLALFRVGFLSGATLRGVLRFAQMLKTRGEASLHRHWPQLGPGPWRRRD